MLTALKRNITTLVDRFHPFTYVNITQFLGAMNDNLYKLLIIYFFIQLEGIEKSHIVLATTGAIYVLPFLLFSSSAGTLADRYSKRNIIICTRTLELFVMLSGVFAFAYSSMMWSYATLFLLATHSALFCPSKYGILPELLPQDKISRSNGIMTSCTYLAVILGTFLASFLLDITNRNFILAALFCVIGASLGVASSLCIKYTPPSGSEKKFNAHFISEVYKTLKMASQQPSLLAAMLGSAFFLFLAAFAQLNMIPFAVQSLHLTDVQGGYLFLLTAIGIGTGSIIAGKVSGKMVELALTPLAGLGITASFYLLYIYSDSLFACIPLVIIIGIFGGMYLVPLDSYVQIASPKQYIGQCVASTTFLSFCGVLCSSALLFMVTEVFGLTASGGFLILAMITLIVTSIYTFLFFDYVTRFFGMILSRLHFKITFIGQKNIPDSPVLYVCTHTAWNDTLLFLGAQRRRMRFFIEHEKDHSKWLKRLYRLLRIVLIPEIEPLENNSQCLTAIRNTLNKGISVCIFIEDVNVEKEFEKLKQSHLVQEILKEKHYPMISVHIEKGEKEKQTRFFTRLLNKFRVPASISFQQVPWEDNQTQIQPSSHADGSNASKPTSKKTILMTDLSHEGFQQS